MIMVTGASKGLGRAICERLQLRGEEVLGLARSVTDLPYRMMTCDVSKPDDIKNVVREIKKQKWEVNGLINAAGIASMNLAITTPAHIAKQIIETNLLGTIYCCQLIAPIIIRKKAGSIINFSTIAVTLGLKGESIYVASKAGVEGFSRAFAREMSDFGVNVNCIAPGPIDTNLIKGISTNQIDQIVKQQIITKQFSPDTICDLVELLLDTKSKSLSGQVFHVGGA